MPWLAKTALDSLKHLCADLWNRSGEESWLRPIIHETTCRSSENQQFYRDRHVHLALIQMGNAQTSYLRIVLTQDFDQRTETLVPYHHLSSPSEFVKIRALITVGKSKHIIFYVTFTMWVATNLSLYLLSSGRAKFRIIFRSSKTLEVRNGSVLIYFESFLILIPFALLMETLFSWRMVRAGMCCWMHPSSLFTYSCFIAHQLWLQSCNMIFKQLYRTYCPVAVLQVKAVVKSWTLSQEWEATAPVLRK